MLTLVVTAVEMVAKPELLLFLDEPSSGLDSQTAWSVLDLLETLKQAGQAVLCTIHQPSAQLFDRFDRLLFLARGGKTVYFGEVGEQSRILRSYFERNGSPQFPPGVNPAEYMLEVRFEGFLFDFPLPSSAEDVDDGGYRSLALLLAHTPRSTGTKRGSTVPNEPRSRRNSRTSKRTRSPPKPRTTSGRAQSLLCRSRRNSSRSRSASSSSTGGRPFM